MCVHTNCKYHNYVLYFIQSQEPMSRDNLYLSALLFWRERMVIWWQKTT
nr:MAG TPA_asm: hypothetical protein [Caudoviricetes sp.]